MSIQSADIALREDFRNGSTPAVDNYKLSSTAEYDNIDPAFIISITDENRTQIEGVQQEEASAGNYEEPVISHSYTSSTGGIGVSLLRLRGMVNWMPQTQESW